MTPLWRPRDGSASPFGTREKEMGIAFLQFKPPALPRPFCRKSLREPQMNGWFGTRSGWLTYRQTIGTPSSDD